jgi:hypothetical protein
MGKAGPRSGRWACDTRGHMRPVILLVGTADSKAFDEVTAR